MRQRKEELDGAGVTVAVVSFEKAARFRAFVRAQRVPFLGLSDEARGLYRAFGMDRGPWWRIYAPRVLWRYAKEIRRGRKVRIRGDTFQRGGDVILDAEGIIRLLHVGADSFDRPSVDELLRRLHALPRRT